MVPLGWVSQQSPLVMRLLYRGCFIEGETLHGARGGGAQAADCGEVRCPGDANPFRYVVSHLCTSFHNLPENKARGLRSPQRTIKAQPSLAFGFRGRRARKQRQGSRGGGY